MSAGTLVEAIDSSRQWSGSHYNRDTRLHSRSLAGRIPREPMRIAFTATIKIRNGNPYIPVDSSRAAAIKEGWRKPLPVRLRINGLPRKAWRVNMMPVGDGSFYLYLHGAMRATSGTA